MSLFENFPWTNLHQLNLGWLIEEVKKCYSPDNPPEAMVISVNGESGEVILYKDAHVALPDITEEQWNLYRGSANKITGIEFNKDNPATRINGNQRFVIYDAGNPPPYPVLAVNGETGNVILYEEPYVVFPNVEGDNWGLERKLNEGTPDEVRVGIMFDDTGKAYLTNDEETKEILTKEDIPTSSGVVSINGITGIVILTGANIPINGNDSASIETIIENKTNKTIISYIENTNVASRNYLSGEYILINNVLYKTKINISNGDTFTNVNTEQTTIGKELTNLESLIINKIHYINVNVGGTAITTQDNGWYYAQVSIENQLPQNAHLINACWTGNWDADVFVECYATHDLIFRCLTSKTLASSRSVKVSYTV